MTFDTTCSRLRLGGSISGSTLSGGTVIDAGGIAISTWSGLLGFAGYAGANPALLGSDGTYHVTGKRKRAATLTLNFRAYTRDATATVTTTNREHLEANLDEIADLISGDGEQIILERDMADGTTRWIQIQALVASAIVQGPVFNQQLGSYDWPVIMTAAYPNWQSEELHTEVINGVDTIVNAGNARISNAVLTFSGAGTFTNDDNKDELTTTAAAIVDVGTRQISNAAVPTPGRLDPPNRDWWLRLGKGTVNVTTDVSVSVDYRDHWQA